MLVDLTHDSEDDKIVADLKNLGIGGPPRPVRSSSIDPVGGRPVFLIDLEATGVNVKTARVLEIAVKHLSTNQMYQTLVNPCKRGIPKEVVNLTGIDYHMVSDPSVPSFKVALEGALAFIREALPDNQLPVLVGHNIKQYDLPLMRNECTRHNCSQLWPSTWLYLDSLILTRKYGVKTASSKYSLGELMTHFKVPPPSQLHRAAADVEVLSAVWPHLLRHVSHHHRQQLDQGRRLLVFPQELSDIQEDITIELLPPTLLSGAGPHAGARGRTGGRGRRRRPTRAQVPSAAQDALAVSLSGPPPPLPEMLLKDIICSCPVGREVLTLDALRQRHEKGLISAVMSETLSGQSQSTSNISCPSFLNVVTRTSPSSSWHPFSVLLPHVLVAEELDTTIKEDDWKKLKRTLGVRGVGGHHHLVLQQIMDSLAGSNPPETSGRSAPAAKLISCTFRQFKGAATPILRVAVEGKGVPAGPPPPSDTRAMTSGAGSPSVHPPQSGLQHWALGTNFFRIDPTTSHLTRLPALSSLPPSPEGLHSLNQALAKKLVHMVVTPTCIWRNNGRTGCKLVATHMFILGS